MIDIHHRRISDVRRVDTWMPWDILGFWKAVCSPFRDPIVLIGIAGSKGSIHMIVSVTKGTEQPGKSDVRKISKWVLKRIAAKHDPSAK